jgi:hypothetical protein
MPAQSGIPIIQGITSSTTPVLQGGSEFSNRTYGLDDGKRSFLVHPQASKTLWPQVGNPDGTANPYMYIVNVTPRNDQSTLILLEVAYRGISGSKPDRIIPDCDVQMLTLPGSTTSGGITANVIVPVPQPKVTREYVTLTQPTNQGVGSPLDGSWLPALPDWEIAFYPDPTKQVTNNYYPNQWVLQARSPDPIIPGKVWFVRERATYFYGLASA